LRAIRAHRDAHAGPSYSHEQQQQRQVDFEREPLYYNGHNYGYNDDTASEPSSSSSPEPYLSDYDEGEDGAAGGEWAREERERRMRGGAGGMEPHPYDTEEGMEMRAGAARVRRGSEGWEVRPASPWFTTGVGEGMSGGEEGYGGDHGYGAAYTDSTRLDHEGQHGINGGHMNGEEAQSGSNPMPRGVARESLSAGERKAWEDQGRYRLYDPDE
jgi:hypothetical protein